MREGGGGVPQVVLHDNRRLVVPFPSFFAAFRCGELLNKQKLTQELFKRSTKAKSIFLPLNVPCPSTATIP